MSNLTGRFKEVYNFLISEAYVSNTRLFAEKIGVSTSMITEISKGRSNVGTTAIQNTVIEYPFINPEWLLTGRGEMLKGTAPVATPVDLPVVTRRTADHSIAIPLIPIDAMAGYAIGESQVLEHECERYVVPMFREAEFLIPIKGSSMIPKYNSGDLAACKRLPLTDLFFQWNKVYVLDTVQGALIKRIKKGHDGDHVLLVSDNEQYDPFELHISQINTIALVIGVIRLE